MGGRGDKADRGTVLSALEVVPVQVLPYDFPPCLKVHLCVDLPGLHGAESSFVTEVLCAERGLHLPVVTSRPHPELSCGYIPQPPYSHLLMKCRNMTVLTCEDLEFVGLHFLLQCSAVPGIRGHF